MDKINEYLNKRAETLMVYKMPKNKDLMEEIFAYDPRTLEATSSENISKYAIGISQFLIYFVSEVNKSKVLLMQKRRFMDISIKQSEIDKGRLIKADYKRKVIDSDEELKQVEIDIEALESELIMVENIEKGYVELINTFKRELGRRESELKFTRDERRM
jgi:hypothetical protein